MPLDPRIALGVQPPPVQNPLEALSTIAQLQGVREQTEARRLAADKARQQAADEAAIRRVLTETGGDVEQALPRLRTIAPKAALEFETEIASRKEKQAAALKNDLDTQSKQLDLHLKYWGTVVDQPTLDAVRPGIVALSPPLDQILPKVYDPAAVQRINDMGLTRKEQLDQGRAALADWAKGDRLKALSTLYSNVGTGPDAPQRWTKVSDLARTMGAKPEEVAVFGDYSPDNVIRAASLGIPSEKAAELAGQAAGRAQTAAHQAETERVARAQLQISQGQLDVARRRLAKGTGTDQDRTALMQAVIENPGLWDQITPTERGKIAGALNAQGFTGFGKPLSDKAVATIAQSESAIASLADLREIVKKNEQYIGPIAGIAAINPYSEANKVRADINRVRQRVGKMLESGVLRKEDELKYKEILATLYDVPETALYKLDQLAKDIQRDIDIYKHQQRLQGRRVPGNDAKPNDPMGIR